MTVSEDSVRKDLLVNLGVHLVVLQDLQFHILEDSSVRQEDRQQLQVVQAAETCSRYQFIKYCSLCVALLIVVHHYSLIGHYNVYP